MDRAFAFIKLVRPINCVMMAAAVPVGVVVAVGGIPAWAAPKVLLGSLTGFTLLAASNAINDYHDREVDAVNEPNRPIPSGLVSPGEALLTAALLTVTGLAAALLTNVRCFLLALAAYAISVSYVTWGKRTGLLGNFMVGTCIAIPFIYGSLIVAEGVDPLTGLFSSTALLSNVGREVTKGIVDVEGDRLQGVKTVAVSHGCGKAAAVAALFYIAAVGLTPIPPMLGLVSPLYTPVITLTDAGFVYSAASLLRDHTRENARRVKQQVLIWMCTALLAFTLGAIHIRL